MATASTQPDVPISQIRPAAALLALLALLCALPMNAISELAAQPMTRGEWMRMLYLTSDREFDTSQDGIAVAPPPLPTKQLQTSSQPAAPKEPVTTRSDVPRLWTFKGGLEFGRQRRRGRRRRR